MTTSSSIQTCLQSVFGYSHFRPLQEDCIESVLRKEHALLIMPTGGGKSLCYQIPALVFKGLTIVVSPLISLMKDQLRQLRSLGIEAEMLNSSLSWEEYDRNIQRVCSGKTKILFLAPETLVKDDILQLLSSLPVDCLTIDEAHCISDWGHDFRPEYRQLKDVRKNFQSAVCLAMTATATPKVRHDIVVNLGLNPCRQFISGFNRHNLYYEVIPKAKPVFQTLDFLNRFRHQSGIIYCFSRKQVESLCAQLNVAGFHALPYHAGLSDDERSHHQDAFMNDEVYIMVATIAFGMGINKPNVRFVVHYDLPKNLESYYQETGRAGRDGLPAHCLLLFGYGDIRKIRYLIDQKKNRQQRSSAQMHLNAMIHFAEFDQCRRIPLLTYFGESYSRKMCGQCDRCTKLKPSLKERFGLAGRPASDSAANWRAGPPARSGDERRAGPLARSGDERQAGRLGLTLMEILIVMILLGLIAGFAIPNFTMSLERNRERQGINDLNVIKEAMELYRSKESGYWNGALDDAIDINNALGIFLAEGELDYSCTSDPGSFSCSAESSDGWTLEIEENGVVHCSVDPCPSCDATACP